VSIATPSTVTPPSCFKVPLSICDTTIAATLLGIVTGTTTLPARTLPMLIRDWEMPAAVPRLVLIEASTAGVKSLTVPAMVSVNVVNGAADEGGVGVGADRGSNVGGGGSRGSNVGTDAPAAAVVAPAAAVVAPAAAVVAPAAVVVAPATAVVAPATAVVAPAAASVAPAAAVVAPATAVVAPAAAVVAPAAAVVEELIDRGSNVGIDEPLSGALDSAVGERGDGVGVGADRGSSVGGGGSLGSNVGVNVVDAAVVDAAVVDTPIVGAIEGAAEPM
jgi:hypothetical protein